MPSRYLEASSSFLFDQKCRGEVLPECIFPPAQPPDPVGGENIYIGSIFSSLAKMYLDRNVSTLLLRYMEALLNLGKNDEILRSWKQGQLLKTFCHLSFSTWLVDWWWWWPRWQKDLNLLRNLVATLFGDLVALADWIALMHLIGIIMMMVESIFSTFCENILDDNHLFWNLLAGLFWNLRAVLLISRAGAMLLVNCWT